MIRDGNYCPKQEEHQVVPMIMTNHSLETLEDLRGFLGINNNNVEEEEEEDGESATNVHEMVMHNNNNNNNSNGDECSIGWEEFTSCSWEGEGEGEGEVVNIFMKQKEEVIIDNVDCVGFWGESSSKGTNDKNVEAEDDQETKAKAKTKAGGLNLNLNYEQVLEAWSNRRARARARARGRHQHPYLGEVPNLEEEEEEEEGRGRREASVVRYKEKRQSRLFANKIRYHVRKLSADNRPRHKGRFVKTILQDERPRKR